MDDSSGRESAWLRLSNLHIDAGSRPLLRDTSLTIPGGKITVIVGGSGAGKSVLLRTLAGLVPRDGETLSWHGGIDVGQDSDKPLPGPKHIGIVFQQFALFDELSPTENVQFAIDHRSDRSRPVAQTAAQWLEELGVPAKTRVSRLSGGQKQRLAIARTLAGDPDIVLYDEPTSGLDSASGQKVAELIRDTHQTHQRTSVIVTHDYQTLIPIADEVLLFDSEKKQLSFVPRDQWSEIASRMKPVALEPTAPESNGSEPNGSASNRSESNGSESNRSESKRSDVAAISVGVLSAADRFLTATGKAFTIAARLPWDALPLFPRPRWGLRFFAHYLRLVGGPSAWVYLTLAGLIVGFTTTYFTFKFLPFRMYTQPLLVDELLASIGFSLYRFLVPVLATILIAARCGAAVAADVGVKQYGGQIDAMQTLGVKPKVYLLVPIILAFVVATPLLQWLSYSAARLISLVTFAATHPTIGPYFWDQHFDRNLDAAGSGLPLGWGWVLLKNLACGVGTAAIGYYRGATSKHSASDVSHSITSTVLWATLYVLVVHFLVALIEF